MAYRYEVDPHNRLVVRKTGEKTKVKRFRKVYDGRFKLGKNNSLTYHIKAPGRNDPGAPHQVKLIGKWSLTKNHDLKITLDKWKRQTFGSQLLIKGEIISVDKNFLVFAVKTRTDNNKDSLYFFKLEGSWQADKYNCLSFKVERDRSRSDILMLRGMWEINKNHEIIYQYEKTQLIRKLKKTHSLTFKGHWDIKDKARISYVLDRSSGSLFDFKTGFGIFKDKYIKYELGIGRKEKFSKKAVLLFGTWKIDKDKGLTFEIEYGNKRISSITFGAEAKLKNRDLIEFNIKKDMDNRDMGINLKISRKMLKGSGEAFLQLLKSSRELSISVGFGKKW